MAANLENPHVWKFAAYRALKQADSCRELSFLTKQALANVPSPWSAGVYSQPQAGTTILGIPSEMNCDTAQACYGRLFEKIGTDQLLVFSDAKFRPERHVKVGYSPTLNRLGQYMNFIPGHFPGGIPNSPSPLTSMLTSGLVGAGVGYGMGSLAEGFLPDTWEKGRLRKTLSALGALGGATPGALAGLSNVLRKKPFNDNAVMTTNLDMHGNPQPWPLTKTSLDKWGLLSHTGLDNLPPIPIGRFNETIWGDPQVAPLLPLPVRGVMTATLDAAQQMPGGQGSGWVTPMQMGHLAAGMGAGYISGALVGGALGMLTGMPQSTQTVLKNTGLYAGIVSTLAPKLFGR